MEVYAQEMVIPGERIAEEEGSEDTDDIDASIGDIAESSDILSSDISSPGTSDIPPPPAYTRSYGKAKKKKDREPFYKGFEGCGVVYLPGDINCIYYLKSSSQVTPQSATNWFMYWKHCID